MSEAESAIAANDRQVQGEGATPPSLNQTKTTRAQLKMQNMRKVLHPRFSTAWGVACEKTKLNSHCTEVPIAIAASRMREGKISLWYSHGTGPHEML